MAKPVKLNQLTSEDIDDTIQWYVAITKFNNEFKFKRDLIEGVAAHNYSNNIFDIFVPIKKFTVEYINSQGKVAHTIITEKILSLYVFFKARLTESLLSYINNLPSCSAVLISGNAVASLDEESVLRYRQLCVVTDDFYKNKKIISKEDPFNNPFNKSLNNLSDNINISNNLVNEKSQVLNNNVFNIILHNEKLMHIQVNELKYKREFAFKKLIFRKILDDEKVVQAYRDTNKKQVICAEGHINFSQINIAKLISIAKKYRINLDSIDLNLINKKGINLDDIYKLQKLIHAETASKKKNKKSIS